MITYGEITAKIEEIVRLSKALQGENGNASGRAQYFRAVDEYDVLYALLSPAQQDIADAYMLSLMGGK